jgi:putative FmdB family regulatory protein
MPVYEYECPNCKVKFEVMRKFSESGGSTCPTCGAEGQRIYCAPFLVFKGPGFYVTDSRTEVDPELEHRKKEKEATEKAEKGETATEAKKAENDPVKSDKADKSKQKGAEEIIAKPKK